MFCMARFFFFFFCFYVIFEVPRGTYSGGTLIMRQRNLSKQCLLRFFILILFFSFHEIGTMQILSFSMYKFMIMTVWLVK